MACFGRQGFHATSMQDVIAEANLSVGAVYRYFPGKNDIIAAIADRYVDGVIGQMDELVKADRPFSDAMATALEVLDRSTEPGGQLRLAVQVWAESLRDPSIAGAIDGVYRKFQRVFIDVADRAIQRGQIDRSNDAECLGPALFSLVLGFGLQKLLTGTPDRQVYLTQVLALVCTPAGPR